METLVNPQHATNTSTAPRLIITHGEKGGVGKTTVARILADYLIHAKTAFRAYDAEGDIGPLRRFLSEKTQPIEFKDAAGIAPVLDQVMGTAPERIALVDLGARAGSDLKTWLYKGGALEEASSGNLGITVVYVIGGSVDSVGHLSECYKALGRDVKYVLVKNLGVASRFPVYEGSHVRRDLLAIGAQEISVPELDPVVFQSVDKSSKRFTEFAEDGQFSYTERRYCRTWLRECFVALDHVATLIR
jgi:hypothetical protein